MAVNFISGTNWPWINLIKPPTCRTSDWQTKLQRVVSSSHRQERDSK